MANNNGPTISVTLNATVVKYSLIMLSSGLGINTTGVASEDNKLVGVAQEGGDAGDIIPVRVINCVAQSDVLVGGAISKGARVFTAASGKGTGTATSLTSVGIAGEAATADGDVIPVIHDVGTNDDIS